MKKLDGKVAVITGGAGGIGLGIATAFVKDGAKVAIVDLDKDKGNEALKSLREHGEESIFIHANLAERNNLPRIIKEVVKTYGKLDILVNNAHASTIAKLEELTQDDLDLSFDTGFYATLFLMQAALPHLRETEGSVINFASGAGIKGHEGQGAYAAAKEAIRAITRVAANEWGNFNINVNLISPLADSEGVRTWAKESPEYYESVLNSIPLRKFGDVEKDIGRVAVFLASEDANYITGQTIMVDGGSVMLT